MCSVLVSVCLSGCFGGMAGITPNSYCSLAHTDAVHRADLTPRQVIQRPVAVSTKSTFAVLSPTLYSMVVQWRYLLVLMVLSVICYFEIDFNSTLA